MNSTSALSSSNLNPQSSNTQPVLTSPAMNQTQAQPIQTTTEQPRSQVPHNNAQSTASTSHPAFENYPHQISGAGGPTATAPFLQDFSLVAEAAKRAQMAVVMRDLEGITL